MPVNSLKSSFCGDIAQLQEKKMRHKRKKLHFALVLLLLLLAYVCISSVITDGETFMRNKLNRTEFRTKLVENGLYRTSSTLMATAKWKISPVTYMTSFNINEQT